MNRKNLTLILIALGLGAAAALLSMLYLKAREAQLRAELTPKVEEIQVVVASRDLLKGDRLDASTLAVRSLPADMVDTGAVRPDEFEKIKGLVLTHNLASGRPLLHSFVDREFPLDFSDTIPQRRRAMTIQVDEINAVSGFIRPGNRIDLFVTLPPGALGPDDEGEQEVLPLLENIEVLATGKLPARDYEERVRLMRMGYKVPDNGNFATLTLNVTPREAAILATAQDKGSLLAVLRNRKDDSGAGFVSVTPDDLKRHARELAAQARARLAAGSLGGRRHDRILGKATLTTREDGAVVTVDGRVIAGARMNSEGKLVLADGTVVDPKDVVVRADGTVTTRDGRVLSVPEKRALGNGLYATRDGRVVTADGKVVEGLRVAEDGTLMTADGTVIDGTGLQVNEKGQLVTADGRVVDPATLKTGADGTLVAGDGTVVATAGSRALGEVHQDADGNLVTADGTVLTGARLDKDGKLVLADGTRVDPKDVIVRADGTVMTRDGRILSTIRAARKAEGLETTADGKVRTADGTVLTGVKLDKDGKLVLADGTRVDPKDVIIHADGTVTRRDGTPLAGVRAENVTLPGMQRGVAAALAGYEVEYIVGGVSKDGVATVNRVPVME